MLEFPLLWSPRYNAAFLEYQLLGRASPLSVTTLSLVALILTTTLLSLSLTGFHPRTKYGSTPLHSAAYHNGSHAVTELLLDACPSAIEQRTEYGALPLHSACYQNSSPAVVELLIAAMPEALQTCTHSGLLPLHIAAQHQRSVEIVRLLLGLERGGATGDATAGGDAADTVVAGGVDPASAEERALMALTALAALTKADTQGNTPLHLAASHNSYGVVRLLALEGAAALEMRNAAGNDPLQCAASQNASTEVVQFLTAAAEEAANARKKAAEEAAEAEAKANKKSKKKKKGKRG
jgi:ankyrin repeat protein